MLLDRVVLEIGGRPQPVDMRIAVDSELHDRIPHHAEEPVAIVETGLDQGVEVIHSAGRPVAMEFDHDQPLRVSSLTWKTSGVGSSLATALGASFFASCDGEHEISASEAAAPSTIPESMRIVHTVCHAGQRNAHGAYDDFAWFYDRYWNEEFHSVAFPILERIWLARVLPGAKILDVCCGTGRLACLLSTRGYRVTGIDASAAMIRHARENAPAAEFQVGDARQFRLPGQV